MRLAPTVLLVSLITGPFAPSAHAQCQTPSTTTGGIVLTFDDNSVDTWHDTRPIFDAYGVRATFFVSNYHSLTAAQKQKLWDLKNDGHEIAAHSYTHGRASDYTTASYMSQQITPQLNAMAADDIFPRNFAYPYGSDVAATTTALFTEFGFVRDTSYYPNHQASYVTCDQNDRFIAGLGIDYQYGLSNADYGVAFDQAMCDNTNLVLYGHRTADPGTSNYYIDHARLQVLFQMAVDRGLAFRRLRDLCHWSVATSGSGPWTAVHDSPRRFDEVVLADFDGDNDADAFRSTGTQWRLLENQGGTFYTSAADEHWTYLNTSSIPFGNLAFHDFDGDGRTDVFRTTGSTWYVSYGGTSSWTYLNSSGYGLDELRFGDFNGDGRTDVFLLYNGRWYVRYGGVGSWTQTQSSGYPLDRLRFGDFNGNGTTDVFVAAGGAWYMSEGATGSWQYLNTSGFGVTSLGFADFNGDGRTDVLRTSGSAWYVSWSGSSSWSLFRFASETLPDLTFADINGDGRDDVVSVAGP